MRLDLDLLARGDLVGDALGEVTRQKTACSLDRLGVGIEGDHAGRHGSDPESQPTVAAAQLEDALVAEVCKPAQRREVSTLRVEHAPHRLGAHEVRLYALRVVPRAPNFCALRRVSSNVERA